MESFDTFAGQKRCPTCGANNSAAAARCILCGTVFPAKGSASSALRCPHCGNGNEDGMAYCTVCGMSLNPPETESVTPPEKPPEKESETPPEKESETPPEKDEKKADKPRRNSFLRWFLPLVACLALASVAGKYVGDCYGKQTAEREASAAAEQADEQEQPADEQETPTDEQETPTDEQETPTDEQETPAEPLDPDRYYLTDDKLSFAFPDGYLVATAEGDIPDGMLTKYDKNRATMEAYMATLAMQDIVLFGVPEMSADTKYDIQVKVKSGYDAIDDLRLHSRSMQELLAEELTAGFATSAGLDSIPFTFHETPEALFIVFSNHGAGYTCRYATILDGKLIYVYGSRSDRELSAEELEALAFVADSMRSEASDPASDTDKTTADPAGTAAAEQTDGKGYHIAGTNLTFSFPDGWIVARTEEEAPEAMLAAKSLDRTTMQDNLNQLKELGVVLYATSDRTSSVSTAVIVTIASDDTLALIGDIRQHSGQYQDMVLDLLAGEGESDYTFHEAADALFVVTREDSEEGFSSNYNTIVDGKLIFIQGITYDAELNAEVLAALVFVADHLKVG